MYKLHLEERDYFYLMAGKELCRPTNEPGMCLFLLALLCMAAPSQADVKGVFMLQSYNYPTHKMGVTAFGDGAPAAITPMGRRFLIHSPGLNAQNGSISLEALDWPNHFLTHHQARLYLRKRRPGDGNEIAARATFTPLSAANRPGHVLFQSVDSPGFFIRHAGYILRLHRNDNSPLFLSDASFRFIQGPYFLLSANMRQSAIGVQANPNPSRPVAAVMKPLKDAHPFHVTFPGLSLKESSVSLESEQRPRHILRHFGYLLDLEDKTSPRIPAYLNKDASFVLCNGCMTTGYWSLESENFPKNYIRHYESRLKIASLEDSPVYRADASYRFVKGHAYISPYSMPGFYIGVRESQPNVVLSADTGERFVEVYPGNNGRHGTVSLESFDRAGYYLTVSQNGDIQIVQSERNDAYFPQGSSFTLRETTWFDKSFSLESCSRPGWYITKDKFSLKLTTYTSTREFYMAASFIRASQPPVSHRAKSRPLLIQSYNYPNYTLGFAFGSQEVFIVQSGKRFVLVSPGLAGGEDTVSLQCVDRPDTYLRHLGGILWAHSRVNAPNPANYIAEATFYLRRDKWLTGWDALEAFNVRNAFLRHTGYRLTLAVYDNSQLFRKDGSFRSIEGPYFVQSYNYAKFHLGINSQNHAMLKKEGHPFYFTHPGLTLDNNTVSLQSHWRRNNFLRHYSYLVDLEDATRPRNPSLFKADASFVLEQDKFFTQYWGLRSVNMDNHYLRHAYYRFKMSPMAPGSLFRKDASFRFVQGIFLMESYNYRGYAFTVDQNGAMYIGRGRGGSRLQFIYPGLTGEPDTVSIELLTSPGSYVTLQGLHIQASRVDTTDPASRASATWRLREELFHKATLSLEALTRPGYYIRHQGYRLLISQSSDEALFRQDASFYRVSEIRSSGTLLSKGPFLLQSLATPGTFWSVRRGGASSGNQGNQRTVTLNNGGGQRFYIQSPGLNNQSHTVSFLSADRPNYYLRHHQASITLDTLEGARRPHVFDREASFVRVKREDVKDVLLFEAVDMPSYFIAVKNGYELKLVKNNRVSTWRDQASFRFTQGPYAMESLVRPNSGIRVLERRNFDPTPLLSRQVDQFLFSQPGLNGAEGTWSIWLARRPSQVLCLGPGRKVTIIKPPRDDEFAQKRCSFKQNPYVNGAHLGFFALESIAFPKVHLSVEKKKGRLIVEEIAPEGHVAMGAAGFRLARNFATLRAYKNADEGVGVDTSTGQNVVITVNTTEFVLVYPGLSNHSGSVSIQVANNRNQFLKHSGSKLEIGNITDSRDGDSFAEDATFYVRENYWYDDTLALESVNLGGLYVRRDRNKRLVLAEDDESQQFKQDASFTVTYREVKDDSQDYVEPLSLGGKIGVALGTFFGGILFVALLVLSDKIAMVCCRQRMLVRRAGRYDTYDAFDNPLYLSDIFSPDLTITYSPDAGVSMGEKAPDLKPVANGLGIKNKPKTYDVYGSGNAKVETQNTVDDRGSVYMDMRSSFKRPSSLPPISNPYYTSPSPSPSASSAGITRQLSADLYVDSLPWSEDYEAMGESGLPSMSNSQMLALPPIREDPGLPPIYEKEVEANGTDQSGQDIYMSPLTINAHAAIDEGITMKSDPPSSSESPYTSSSPATIVPEVESENLNGAAVITPTDSTYDVTVPPIPVTEAGGDSLSENTYISADLENSPPGNMSAVGTPANSLGSAKTNLADDGDIPSYHAPLPPGLPELPAPFPHLRSPLPDVVTEATYAQIPPRRKPHSAAEETHPKHEEEGGLEASDYATYAPAPPLPARPQNIYERPAAPLPDCTYTIVPVPEVNQLSERFSDSELEPSTSLSFYIGQSDEEEEEEEEEDMYATIDTLHASLGQAGEGVMSYPSPSPPPLPPTHSRESIQSLDNDLPASQSLAEATNCVLGPTGDIIPLPVRRRSKNNLLDIFSSTDDEGDQNRERKSSAKQKLPTGFDNPVYDLYKEIDKDDSDDIS